MFEPTAQQPFVVAKPTAVGLTWLSLPRDERQRIIQGFYQVADLETAQRLMQIVRAPVGYGVYASAGPNYEFAVFGRDSLQFAEDVLHILPDVSREIILLLARLQGVVTNHITEEEPGKIHHEYRSRQFNGLPISASSSQVYDVLAAKWGGTGDEMCYYGSIDATPLFIRLACDFSQRIDNSILDEPVARRDGNTVSLKTCINDALTWLTNRLNKSEWRLLEFKRMNPQGLPYQAWKDSETGYLHTDGRPANADGGIASIELQGFAFDALCAGADTVAESPAEAQAMRKLAGKVRDNTLRYLWMPKHRFFAIGLDRNELGERRQIATLTTNPGQLLTSRLWSTLDPGVAKKYTDPVVERLMSDDFLTQAGLRCRALSHADLINSADYHGSLVTWPRDTSIVAQGMRALGYTQQATDLEECILRAVATAGEFYEFFLVNRDGHVKYRYRTPDPAEPMLDSFACVNATEPGQAWTISSVIRIVENNNGRQVRS